MITVSIGELEKECDRGIEKWIAEQFKQRRKNGEQICVIVTVKKGDVDVLLSTPGCAGGGVGGRQPNSQEQQILEIWSKLHLNTSEFTQGNLIAFLERVRDLG